MSAAVVRAAAVISTIMPPIAMLMVVVVVVVVVVVLDVVGLVVVFSTGAKSRSQDAIESTKTSEISANKNFFILISFNQDNLSR